MKDPLDRVVRAIARRNSYALVWAQFGLEHVVVFGGLGLLSLYQPMSSGRFWTLVAVSQGLVAIDNIASIKLTRRMWRPIWAWERGPRGEASAVAAWTALATLPLDYMRRMRKYPLVFSYLPFIAFTAWLLELHWWSFFVLSLVGTSVVATGLIIRYTVIEIVSRPVLEGLAADLPDDFEVPERGLPLRWRLLAAAPVINVITAIVVAGLSARGHHQTLQDLGLAWVFAVVVAFTVSLELVVLVVRSLGSTLADVQRATERIRAGDYSARVPVVATDETGRLAQSFNTMAQGLDERERLREAFGAYVDPKLAERVLHEGSDLEGELVEATIMFLDVRDFTAYAEAVRPDEVVTQLSELWELVVPVLLRHAGHANKFLGDGVLAVFGAPDRVEDHADRAAHAALEIVAAIEHGFDGRLHVGIGINTGRVVVGTVGGGGRVEFTVIGDPVNTASRVERATRATGDAVLITEAVRSRLARPECFGLDEREPMELKGKSAPVRLWALSATERTARAGEPSAAPGVLASGARGDS